jgi:2-polyprenyl-3-methyl-5-hydroxy-6-metoxy-1,4-benzoquinol methylase
MSHCSCEGLDRCFDCQHVARDLEDYRRDGAPQATRLLIAALQAQRLDGMTLLDIGGGIGAIPLALLQSGVTEALDVDASAAYLDVARAEAERLCLAERLRFLQGNFVEVAATIAPADIVTLDRVICCFDDMPALVGASAARAKQFYGLIFPRDTWWMRLFSRVRNGVLSVTRAPLRFYVHATTAVDAVVRAQGLERCSSQRAGAWQVVLYARRQPLE